MENPKFKSFDEQEKVNVPFEAPKHYFDEFPTKITHLISNHSKLEPSWFRLIRLTGLPIGFATIVIIVMVNRFQYKKATNEEIFQEYIAAEAIDGIDEYSFIEVDIETESDTLSNKKIEI